MKNETKIVWIAALVQFINIIDFMMVMPLGPDISNDLPITNADIGLICGCYTLAVGFSGIACAKFLDRYDRKTVAIVTMLGLSIATLSAAFSWDLYSMVVARVLAGLFGGPAAAIAFQWFATQCRRRDVGRLWQLLWGLFPYHPLPLFLRFGIS